MIKKKIIKRCLAAAKPVIVATQMLDSMAHNIRPTRAEVSDVANAVIDHADAVMLSAETASGEFPVETVTVMAKIASRTETSVFDDLEIKPSGKKNESLDDAISEIARLAADKVGAKAILAASIFSFNFFTSYLRFSSVNCDTTSLILSPSLTGLMPKSAATTALSTSLIMFLSQGVMTMLRASGTLIEARLINGVLAP